MESNLEASIFITFQAGGFLLPFLLFGLIALASLIPLYYVLPADKTRKFFYFHLYFGVIVCRNHTPIR